MKESITNLITVIIVSALGGICNHLLNDKTSVIGILIASIVATFAGFITWKICLELQFSENVISACCGMAGFSSSTLLNIYKEKFLEKVKRGWLK